MRAPHSRIEPRNRQVLAKMKIITKGTIALVAVIATTLAARIVLGTLLRPAEQILSPAEATLFERARQLHHDALVVDAHDDVLTYIVDYQYDLAMNGNEPDDRSLFLYYGFSWLPFPPHGDEVQADMDFTRIRKGGLDAQFFPIWVNCEYYRSGIPGASSQRAFEMIEALKEQERRHPEHIKIAYTVKDVEQIVSDGKLAAILAIEGGHAIEDNLETLAEFHKLGVRYMTLTHSCSNNWADSSSDENLNGGLTEFGLEVVQEMNRLGIIVDVSHVSDETFWDVIQATGAPVMASHSSVRSIANHPRNMTDEMIRAVGVNNGVVMINFMTLFIDPEKIPTWKVVSKWHWFTHPRQPETPLSLVIDHIDHVVNVAGIDHVGLGSDFDNTPFLPENLKDVSDYPNITFELLRRGYSETDILKILGRNVLRVLAEVEQIAGQNLVSFVE